MEIDEDQKEDIKQENASHNNLVCVKGKGSVLLFYLLAQTILDVKVTFSQLL